MSRVALPASGAGHIQFVSDPLTRDEPPSETTALLPRSLSNRPARRRQALLLLQGEWPWGFQRAWLRALARFGRRFWDYERWSTRVWQAALWGALAYDMTRYVRFPEERFGNTPVSIVFGWAQTPETLARHWGSDRVPEAMFWVAPGVLLTLALSSLLRAACYRPVPLEGLVSDEPLAFHRAGQLQAAGSLLSCESELSPAHTLCLIHNLGQTSLIGRFPLTYRYRAIALLACFAGRATWDEGATPVDALACANTYLTFHLAAARPWPRRLYTRYHLWRQGLERLHPVTGHSSYAFRLWALSQFALGWFARYHYWRLLGDKLAHLLAYLARQAACEASGKHFFYAPWQDQDVCALCPDWAFVRLAERDNLQACVSGLLQQPMSAQALVQRLKRFEGHTGLRRVDLSAHAWAYAWSPETLSQVLEALQGLLNVSNGTGLAHLSVSNKARQTGVVSPARLQALAAFVEQARPRQLSMRHHRLGRSGWAQVLPAFVNHTRALDVSMSDLGDAGVWRLTRLLPGGTLEHLIARASGLSDGAVWALDGTWDESALTVLEIADNALTDEGFAGLASMFSRRAGVRLDVSGMRLSVSGARRFWPVVRHVEHLVLRETGLREASLLGLGRWLTNSTLRVLDMRHNALLGDGALWGLAPEVLAAGVWEWRLAHTGLSPLGLAFLGERLVQAPCLRVLDVSGCVLGDGASSFFNGALQSGLHSLWLDEVGLTREGLAALTAALRAHPETRLRVLSLKGQGLPSTEVATFFEALGEGACCEGLRVSGHGLNDTVLAPLGRLLAQERLQRLDVSDNRLTTLSPWGPHGRSLRVLDTSGNALTGAGVMGWAQASLTPMPYFDRLRAGTLSRAQRRDFSTLRATGALRRWDVLGPRFGAEDVRTLCRVAEQAAYEVRLFDDAEGLGCARPDALEPPSPGLGGSSFFRASSVEARPAGALRLGGGFVALSGFGGPMLWGLLFLSLLWLWRACRARRTREEAAPEATASLG